MKRNIKSKADGGFTILEIIITVAIIGVLIAIALPIYGNIQEKGHASVMKADLRNATKAMEKVLVDTGSYESGLPPTYSASEGYNVEFNSTALSELPAAVQSVQATHRGLSSRASYEEGITAEMSIDSTTNTITVSVACPSSSVVTMSNREQVLCSWPGNRSQFTSLSTPASSIICRAPNGTYSVRTGVPGPQGSLMKARPSNYITGSPQAFNIRVTGVFVCNPANQTLVGFARANQDLSGNLVRPAFGTGLAIPAPARSYCLEATSAKTNQVYSISKYEGFKEQAC